MKRIGILISLGILGITAGALLFFGSYQPAYAYPLDATSSNPGILTPFQNFITSIGSISSSSFTIGQPSGTPNSFLVSAGESAWANFDAWLYGIAGFHITNFFTDILAIFSWILGTIQSGVDSLRKLLS